jgi:hypothetical protein
MPILNIHNTIAMEKRLNKRIETYVTTFKDKIKEKITALDIGDKTKLNEFIEFVYEYERLVVGKDDINNRKRVKNSIPNVNRCCAKRANGEQCTRRKKGNEMYCGTHIKGTPNSVMEEPSGETPTTKNVKVDIWAQDIKGIIYYIDKAGNVYDTEDIMKIDKYPKRVIAKYAHDGAGNYSIPSIFGNGGAAVVVDSVLVNGV